MDRAGTISAGVGIGTALTGHRSLEPLQALRVAAIGDKSIFLSPPSASKGREGTVIVTTPSFAGSFSV